MPPEIEQESTYLLNSIPDNLAGWKKEYTKDIYLSSQSQTSDDSLTQTR